MADDLHDDYATVEQTTLADFLMNFAPGRMALVDEALDKPHWVSFCYYLPEIVLHCTGEPCKGNRTFQPHFERDAPDSRSNAGSGNIAVNLHYRCRNCEKSSKSFSLIYDPKTTPGGIAVRKIGEWPPFGPPTPARVFSLVGTDQQNYVKGMRSEFQGLGIGAFAYYRRVVEHQKNRLLNEIIKVAQRTGATEVIDSLEKAKSEVQFTKAIGDIKPAVPESLKINTHNPLTLLHSALSDGLHDQSDDHCLEMATAIRVVLAELADRIGQALRDEKELESAVSKLLAKK